MQKHIDLNLSEGIELAPGGKLFQADVPIEANLELVHRNKHGFILERRRYHNVVTNTGKAAAASRWNGDGAEALFNRIGIGIGTTSEVAGDTALQTERAIDGTATTTHVTATVSRVTTTVANDTARHVSLFSFVGISSPPLAVTESGLFNAATGGVMACRKTFAALNMNNGDSLSITWDIKFA